VISPLVHVLYLAAFLFSAGLVIVIIKQNTIMLLIGIELMLNGANLNLVAFNRIHSTSLEGQMFSIFVIIVAVAEAGVGLAIILSVYKHYQTSLPEEVSQLKD
jgi:NADH:ubiquinone oxidoreductase subunit K